METNLFFVNSSTITTFMKQVYQMLPVLNWEFQTVLVVSIFFNDMYCQEMLIMFVVTKIRVIMYSW